MHILDDIIKQEKIDTEDMYNKIIHLPEHILKAYQKADIFKPRNFSDIDLSLIKNVVICGMGGSAISGDIAASAFGKNIPITVCKNYEPDHVSENTLVICCSYSGNTEETISCLRFSIKNTPFIATITTGGQLKEILQEKYYLVNIETGLPPRSAIGILFFSLVKILEDFHIIENQAQKVHRLVALLIKKANAISCNKEYNQNIAKISTEKIKNKIPIIYATEPQFAALAYRWKCQINENAKYPAFYHVFPEMNHNEIEGWEAEICQNTFIPVFLSKFSQDKKYQKRIDAFKKIIDKQDIAYIEFFAEGESLVEQIFSLIYLGDMISYYLAILYEVNPTTIDFIDILKKNISDKS